MEEIKLALACDERYFPGLVCTVSSILISTDARSSFIIYILDGGIKKESIEQLSFILKKFRNKVQVNMITIDTEFFKGLPTFFYESKMTYARLLLPLLLLNVEKIIYLDVDILVLKDISKLWNIEFKTHAAVCVESKICKIKNDCPIYEKLKMDGNAPYFNAGLMVLNLEKLRKDNITGKTFDYLRQYPSYCKFWDQSALNITLYNKLTWLDNSWNVQAHGGGYNPINDFNLFKSLDINFHFVTPRKPWLSFSKQPEYRLCYILFDEIGYILSQDTFLNSKNLYVKKSRIVSFLPAYYLIYGRITYLIGKVNKAATLFRVADHWTHTKMVHKYLNKNKPEVQALYKDWTLKIRSKMTQFL